ncbi:MAG: hypothetical protein WCF22_10340 [Candidatus Sulfotelmatobacter sp.]
MGAAIRHASLADVISRQAQPTDSFDALLDCLRKQVVVFEDFHRGSELARAHGHHVREVASRRAQAVHGLAHHTVVDHAGVVEIEQ